MGNLLKMFLSKEGLKIAWVPYKEATKKNKITNRRKKSENDSDDDSNYDSYGLLGVEENNKTQKNVDMDSKIDGSSLSNK